MRQNLLLELLEDGENVSLYSPRFEGEIYTEFEKFILEYKDKDEFSTDLGVIFARINVIKEKFAEDRYFRYEGTTKDRVRALPAKYIDSSKLRVYCIVVSKKVVVLGNGGIKNSETYNEDAYLNSCVETLQKIDFEIKVRENKKLIVIKGSHLEGDLSFYIK
ncbi:MAG: hypothetical protein MJ237_09605 [bacterium]|nr:hypothetical protein [bacterium]